MATNTSSSQLVFLSLGKTIAQITAQFAPIPGLVPLVDALCGIIQLCENVCNNRYAARQLRDRCHNLVLSLREYEANAVSDNMVQARNTVHDCLAHIHKKMLGWTGLGRLESLIQQDKIAKDIALCHDQISDCLNTFNLTSQFEIHAWMVEFEANNKQDHAQLIESLSQIQEHQAIIEDSTSSTNDLVQQMMAMLQKVMGENKQNAEKMHEGLSMNLYQFQSQFQELLPDFYLQSGEVKRVGDVAVRGTASMDIYEGIYLGRERVDIKAIRTMKFDEQSKRRFMREAKIWGQVWKRDRGRHIVPFYGYCQIGGPFPCMVSPSQKYGDALSYVQANDKDLDYIKFIRHVASGVEVLHNMDLVHGDIRATNILVNDIGNPLLSDFRLSKLIQDVTGAPLTQTSMMTDSCRHFAPEALVDDGVVSRASDIYALGMTILEIMTHQQPYRNIKHHLSAVNNAQNGIQPERPTEADALRRGLDDKLWGILVESWSLDPSLRPSIQMFTSL